MISMSDDSPLFAGAVTEESSVLRYGPREGPSDYAHPEFTPLFMDEMTAAQRQAGENVCGASDTACIYDYTMSGSQTFALRTEQSRDMTHKDNAKISDYSFIRLVSLLLARVHSLFICVCFYLSVSLFLSRTHICLLVFYF